MTRSLLFLNSRTIGIEHPDTDDRIDSIIKKLNPEPQNGMWGMDALAYKLLDGLYGKSLVWEEGLKSQKDIYKHIKEQVEGIKN